MHPEALSYVGRAKRLVGRPQRVVEFGSYDVNGSPRQLWSGVAWHGIDIRAGRGVDEVADCRDYENAERFDLCVTTETLEHCAEPWRALDAAWRVLKPGGYLIATMAAPERPPHDGNGDPWTEGCGEHYQGIGEAELREWLSDWKLINLEHDPDAGDLRCVARRLTRRSSREPPSKLQRFWRWYAH